jgi:hypothetical protein
MQEGNVQCKILRTLTILWLQKAGMVLRVFDTNANAQPRKPAFREPMRWRFLLPILVSKLELGLRVHIDPVD